MSDQSSRETAMRYIKQVCVAVAILLVLFGVIQVFNSLSDLADIYVSYYLWVAFQIIAAILIIFIGFRVYSIAKTIKTTDSTHLWKEAHPQVLALLLGFIALLPVTLIPLQASNLLHPQLFQPCFTRNPISFPYKLNYGWRHSSGAYIDIYTKFEFRHGGIQILADIIPIYNWRLAGWIIVPYEIYDPPLMHPQVISPATARIELGFIENGCYVLKVLMSDAIDIFMVRKTDNKFWFEERKVTRGNAVEKTEFEKRLDGFRVEFTGFPNIDDDTKDFVLESIDEIGGVIVETKSYSEGWSVYVYLYYNDDLSKLRQIIIEVAEKHPEYWIRISSNTGWFTQTSQYNFLLIAPPENAESARKFILGKGFRIYAEKSERSFQWEDSVKFCCSSAPLNKTWVELREDFIESISQELGLQYSKDFWVSYC